MRIRNFINAALAAALVAGAASPALAQTPWQAHHPRRAEVNHRLANQNHRIAAERRAGEISGPKARLLHAQDRWVRAQERVEASRHGGHITRAEKRHLNREENKVSRNIAR